MPLSAIPGSLPETTPPPEPDTAPSHPIYYEARDAASSSPSLPNPAVSSLQSEGVHPLYEDVKPASLQEPYQLTVCSAYGVSTAK